MAHQMEEKECISCGNSKFLQWGGQNKYSILQCEHCLMAYTWPVPTDAEMKEANLGIYTIESRINAYRSNENQLQLRYAEVLKEISSFKPNGRLLDVGCNLGFFVKAATGFGFQAEGVELNSECAEYAQQETGIKVFSGLLSQTDFKDQTFDVVTVFDVLEHVSDPLGFLAEIRQILKPDGILVMQMPNIRSVMALLTHNDWPWLCPPDHVFHFSPQSISNLLKKSGFIVRKLRTWEPASDFVSSLKAKSAKNRRVVERVERRTKVFTVLIHLFQRVWWMFGYGGLVLTFSQPKKE